MPRNIRTNPDHIVQPRPYHRPTFNVDGEEVSYSKPVLRGLNFHSISNAAAAAAFRGLTEGLPADIQGGLHFARTGEDSRPTAIAMMPQAGLIAVKNARAYIGAFRRGGFEPDDAFARVDESILAGRANVAYQPQPCIGLAEVTFEQDVIGSRANAGMQVFVGPGSPDDFPKLVEALLNRAEPPFERVA